MKLEEFKDALLKASQIVENANSSPLSGWGLYTRSQRLMDLLDWIDLGHGSGCMSATCLHNSHSPFAHHRAALPKVGVKITELGYEKGFIYALLKDDEVVLCRVVRPQHYWAHIDELDINEISAGLRAEILKNLQAEAR